MTPTRLQYIRDRVAQSLREGIGGDKVPPEMVAELLAEMDRLRADVDIQRWAKWITMHKPEFFRDHACAECMIDLNGKPLVKDGFRCTYHEAVAVVSPVRVEESHP